MVKLLNFAIFFIYLCTFSVKVNSILNDLVSEGTLRSLLLTGYDVKSRPSSYTEINMTLILMSLNELSISEQYISTTSILYMEWIDERLKWIPLLSGADSLVFDATEIWIPPIIVDNRVRGLNLIGTNSIPFSVYPDGKVVWKPPVILDTSCEMDVVYFPMESQECSINFFVYGYSVDKVSLFTRIQEPEVNLDYYGENAGWLYESASTSDATMIDNSKVYRILKYHLKFRRRWLFLALTLMLPTMMNLLLMLGVFFLHVESGEKMGYSLTVLLSYIVLLTFVGDSLPQVSTDISILQIYLAIVLFVGCISTLLTVWVITVYNKDEDIEPVTPRIRCAMKWLILPFTHGLFWTAHIRKLRRQFGNKVNDSNMVHTSVDNCDTTNDLDSSGSWYSETGSRVNFIANVPSRATYSPDSTYGSTLTDSSWARMALQARSLKTVSTSDIKNVDVETNANNHNEKEMYAARASPKPPTLTTSESVSELQKSHDEIEEFLFRLRWKDIAVIMDSFFLRILGSFLLLFTFSLVTILFLHYHQI